jgi:hypothetical protein
MDWINRLETSLASKHVVSSAFAVYESGRQPIARKPEVTLTQTRYLFPGTINSQATINSRQTVSRTPIVPLRNSTRGHTSSLIYRTDHLRGFFIPFRSMAATNHETHAPRNPPSPQSAFIPRIASRSTRVRMSGRPSSVHSPTQHLEIPDFHNHPLRPTRVRKEPPESVRVRGVQSR